MEANIWLQGRFSSGKTNSQREYDWESAITKLEETYAELLSAKDMARYRS